MKKIIVMLLIAALALMGAAFAETAATEEVIDRFSDTWVADGYTAEIFYDEAEGGFKCDMVIGDTFCDFTDCHYDAAKDALVCEGGVRYHSIFDEATVDYKKDVISEGVTAVFTIADDKLACEDSEGLVKGVAFLRLDAAEELDAAALYDGSAIYSNADVEEAFLAVEDAFNQWEGCEMHDIRYAGDECVTEKNLAWLNGLKDKEYKDVIEILTDFHSPVEGNSTLDLDTEYENYEWWLARTDGGSWELVTNGY